MSKILNLTLDPETASERDLIVKSAASRIGINPGDIGCLRIIRRSVDARKPEILINLSVEVFISGETLPVHHHAQRRSTGAVHRGVELALPAEQMTPGRVPLGMS